MAEYVLQFEGKGDYFDEICLETKEELSAVARSLHFVIGAMKTGSGVFTFWEDRTVDVGRYDCDLLGSAEFNVRATLEGDMA